MLKFRGAWRFSPPAGCEPIPIEMVDEIFDLIKRTAVQDEWCQGTLERFKTFFARAGGAVDNRSSSAGWAESDLLGLMHDATANPPLFIEAFYDGWEASRNQDLEVPDADVLNGVLVKHGVPFRIAPPDLEAVGAENATVIIPVPENPPTLAERAVVVLQRSLERSEHLWQLGRDREAVQEILFLLESVATAFRGVDTEAGEIGGTYFNQIVRELRTGDTRPALDQVLGWLATMHGYLSAPAGGGIRHGLDLKRGVEITHSEARLYCNLTRSYLSFLLAEHERLVAQAMQ